MKTPKFLSILILLLFITNCGNDSQRAYVKIEIPPSLEPHPEAVEQLEASAKGLNKILNSVDDYAISFQNIFEQIVQLDTTMSKAEAKVIMDKSVKKVAYSHMKLMANIAYFAFKQSSRDKEIEQIKNELSGEALVAFNENIHHVSVNEDLLKARGDSLLARLDELNTIFEAKKEELELQFAD